MAIRHELILELSDLNIISIQCKSCDTRILLSLEAVNWAASPKYSGKERVVPSECASCGDDWKTVHQAVQQFSIALKSLEQFKVTFHVPTPAKGE